MRLRQVFMVSLWTALSLLAGCRSYGVWVTAVADPSLAPTKAEPIFVRVPDRATIDERQMLLVLKDELCRGNFNVVDDPAKATWIMMVSASQYSYAAGSSGHGAAIPVGGLLIATNETTINYQTDKVTFLSVTKAADRIELEPRPYWEGRVVAKDNVWRAYRPILYKPLLDQYGQNYDRFSKVSKSYLKHVNGCEVEK